MIPRLRAEEAIGEVNRIAMGRHVKFDRHEFRRLKRQWERTAFPRVPQPATATNVWGGLADGGGIKVVLVPVKHADG